MLTLSIPDMSCGHCRSAIESAVAALDPQAATHIDLPARRAEIDTQASPQAVIAALAAIGFAAAPV
ncbi:heavy-metal-associated domain-containing protein [Szabonella alba]|uniref:Heavy-metal-associated domain-containing protein n=1 Tax=Szabonella alba TaxID=2804194 RepID=A0A8K0V9Z3_9RHOB|nr:heavy-metal-associated domain-containing protein [Szabonella alba]MBL4916085.1 heavy-metal-associated domain-containing protein [Szabonella alba]